MLIIKAEVRTSVLFHNIIHTTASFSAHQGTIVLKLSQQQNGMKSFWADSPSRLEQRSTTQS